MFNWRWPQRWFNRLLLFIGVAALVLQLLLSAYFFWQQLYYPVPWLLSCLAPCFCILWGVVPKLQLQREHSS